MKLGTAILFIAALVAIGAFLAPFAAVLYALATFSLGEIVKGLLIAYVALIPLSILTGQAR